MLLFSEGVYSSIETIQAIVVLINENYYLRFGRKGCEDHDPDLPNQGVKGHITMHKSFMPRIAYVFFVHRDDRSL
jgi:hypothetical protein